MTDTKTTTFTVEAFATNFEAGSRDRIRTTISDEVGPPAWESLDDTQRAALSSLVATALAHMAETVEDWLPEAAVARSNTAVGFFVLWENGSLHSEVLRLASQAEADHRGRIADLLRMARHD